MSVFYIERSSGEKIEEQIYCGAALRFFYGKYGLAPLISKNAFLSTCVGALSKTSFSKKLIPSFIKKYGLDESEFSTTEFSSFNDFFIRKLKKGARPLAQAEAIIPADGRYLVIPNLATNDGFYVKGERFSLSSFLRNRELAEQYAEGSMVIGRLCPTDYHRFHFPVDATPSQSLPISGALFSVNPIALKQNIHIFSENKRMITTLSSSLFGKVLAVEVGATNVGTMTQTYTPEKAASKGDEKGFFSFGGSSLVLLFPPHTIHFSADLIENSAQRIETRCLMGQQLGERSKHIEN